ncbi:MAG: hypothetical protein V3T77_05735 [Planctomycetota bacterium]
MDPLRTLLLAGLGAVSYSQEKLKGAIHAMVEKGELSREQGEKVLSEWIDRGKDEQEKLGERVSGEMQRLFTKLSLVTQDEFKKLVTRVERLERMAGE